MAERTAVAREELERDFGFGGRVAQQSTARFVNRDGSFNVTREGLSFFRSLSLYHTLLTTTWPRFIAMVTAAYLATNLLFATAFLACGQAALLGSTATDDSERFQEAFFFSVQTLATIGYGAISPHGLPANLLVTLEALIGLLGFALATGLVFSRFSRPIAEIIFSERALIAPYRGGAGLMFRIANQRTAQLLDVRATVSVGWWENVGGVRMRRFHELRLERHKVLFFPLHWVVVHPIDEKSPLWSLPEAQFMASDPEVLILLTAVEETFSQTVHARSSYKGEEIVWGFRFRDMFLKTEDQRMAVDMRRLHEIEPAALPAEPTAPTA